MSIRYPLPLRSGDLVVVMAPSSGVEPELHTRLDLVLAHLRSQGFRVEEGRCLRQQVNSASASADERAAELMQNLMRHDVAAIIPPWGGELAVELLDRMDWAALTQARPKWLLGFSDTSTWMLAISLRLGWATAHGSGLMDLVPGQQDALTRATLSALSTPAGASLSQRQSERWQLKWGDFANDPAVSFALTEPTRWWALRGETQLQMRGRLIGGCIDTLMHTAGTVHGDVAAFIRSHAADGTLLYLENSGLSPTDWVRALHRLRWAGWLDGLAGVLIGRSSAPDTSKPDELRYAQALLSTLDKLPCPVLCDMDIGHRPPQLVLINGALAELSWSAAEGGSLVQHLV